MNQLIERHLDTKYLVKTLSRLAKVPTEVPMGYETYMEPDDPKLVHYVQRVMRPELEDLGVYDLLDVPPNNLVARVGEGRSGRSLLIMNYTPVQHNNLMEDPFSGKIATVRHLGVDTPAVHGQGVSQSKAHQTVMLTVLKVLILSGVRLSGKLYWAINNEGRSSHACSYAILDALDPAPQFGIVQLSTGLRLSLGNRGRIDALVHVQGRATHSSTPEAGHSAIDGAYEVMTRLKKLTWPDEHSVFGGRHAIVYKIQYSPLAPHTLPSDAYLTVDRRLLPGDDPQAALEELRQVIGQIPPFTVDVQLGPVMLPAYVPEDEPWVGALQRASNAAVGSSLQTFYGRGTFDAGGPCSRGVPTVMFGAGGGAWPLGPDYVPISAVESEAKILAQLILSELGD
jgi:acetylornithine deacetylase/succinyl-diaminopimelate desuccinylase-like protein